MGSRSSSALQKVEGELRPGPPRLNLCREGP